MSSLQISLAVAGGLVLAAVVAHSAWTSRRNAPRQAQPESSPPEGSREPLARDRAPGSRFRRAPGVDAACPLPEKKPGLDALIDVIAPIALEASVSGDAALAAMPPTRRAGSKPFRHRRPERVQRALGNAGGRPALPRVPGRRAAGQPHRRPQRDRVLRVCHEGAGLCRCRQWHARVSRDARGGGARPRTGPVRQRARCPARLHAARPQRGLEPGLRAAECRAPGLCAGCHSRPHGAARQRRRACRPSWA